MKTKVEFEGKVIEISSRHVGIDTPAWGGGNKKHHYKIVVRCEGKEFTEDYWCPDAKIYVRR